MKGRLLAMLVSRSTFQAAGILAVVALAVVALAGSMKGGRRAALLEKAPLSPQAAKQMQLWGWNMGYEHHEQKPLFFGAKSHSVKQAPSQALWMYNMGYEHHEQEPVARWAAKSKNQAPSQALWMYNMGYEHHEQPSFHFFPVK
mmetsp:Transcript_40856/g.98704  ORF Transcript_40856/g.98704 Transcript_40856/m.98704 type:complete len:144 (+) Transcript_40856:3-434(+)